MTPRPPGPPTPRMPGVTLTLRVGMEAGIIAALAWWGYHSGPTTAVKIALAVAVPAAGFGFWGAVDFRHAGRLAEPLRLAQELVISGLAAAALYATGQYVLGWALAGTSVAYHALVYASGGRLLKPRPAEPQPLPITARAGGGRSRA
jgi:Protein of unknown function (DUF2568)